MVKVTEGWSRTGAPQVRWTAEKCVCVGKVLRRVGRDSWRFVAHTHTHTHIARTQVQGQISHSSPTNFTALTVYVWVETTTTLCEPVIVVCVCVGVCYSHAQLCAGLARGCLIERLQVITCPSILLNCQIVSSVTSAVMTRWFLCHAEVV